MALKTVGILGSTGFIGNRICENLNNQYKIVKVNRKLKLKKKIKIDFLICCSGPNKFWCEKNKKKILKNSTEFGKNILNFCKKNNVRNLIYCSTIQVLNKNNNQLIPYIRWHQNIEKYLGQLKINKKIIRLPNLFGKPNKNKKKFWNFFINSIIKNSYLNKAIKIKNRPNQIIFAMPLSFFIEFLKKEIEVKFVKLTKTINLNTYYKFRTDELIFVIQKILKEKFIFPKITIKGKSSENFILKNIMKNKEYLIFNKEIQGLIKFVKKSF